ncbi:6907_t:CDS:1, partial [Rhizophagus irregularis]
SYNVVQLTVTQNDFLVLVVSAFMLDMSRTSRDEIVTLSLC